MQQLCWNSAFISSVVLLDASLLLAKCVCRQEGRNGGSGVSPPPRHPFLSSVSFHCREAHTLIFFYAVNEIFKHLYVSLLCCFLFYMTYQYLPGFGKWIA